MESQYIYTSFTQMYSFSTFRKKKKSQKFPSADLFENLVKQRKYNGNV